jgi:hypothetical protein
MSKHASTGTAMECEVFSQGTARDADRWWYHGDTERGCRRILEADRPFRNCRRVSFSSCKDGCQHKAEHTHVIRARVFVEGSLQYSVDMEGNGLIRDGELWLHVKDPRCIKVDRDYIQPIDKARVEASSQATLL